MPILDTITAWFHITDKCNLRCSYCYLPHEPLSISLQTATHCMDRLFASAIKYQSTRVGVKYAGGEPLIEWDRLLEISKYAKKLSQIYSIDLHELIITNATLLDKQKLHTIKELKLNLTISYDGYGANSRPYVNGKSSSNDVLESIKLALDCGVKPNISIVVNNYNIDGLESFIEFIQKESLNFKINLSRTNIHSKDGVLQEDKIIAGMKKIFKAIEDNPNSIPVDDIFDEMSLEARHKTCGAGENYLVFNVDGSISKCQMQMDKPVATYHDKDPIAKIQADTQFVRSFDVDSIHECQECYIRYYCKGGCPLETFNRIGHYQVKSPHCNIYKNIFGDLMRLKGKQLQYLKK